MVGLSGAIAVLWLASMVGVFTVDRAVGGGSGPAPQALRDSPVATQIRFLLDNINTGAGDAELAARLTPAFLAEVPESQLRDLVRTSLRPGGPWVVEDIEDQSDHEAELLIRGASGAAATVRIEVEPRPPHRVSLLLFLLAPEAPPPVEVRIPSGPAGEQLRWALAVFNGGPLGDDAELAERLAPSFLAAISLESFRQVTGQIVAFGPFTLERWVGFPGLHALEVVVRNPDGERRSVKVATEDVAPHRVTGLLVDQAPSATLPASWPDLDAALRAAAPEVAFVAAELVDGECRPVHAIEPDQALSLGSAFKLYVLGALAEEVELGRARWDETVVVREERRVHSSLRYGSTPAGTAVPLLDLAQAMIEVSDNTATDLLLDRVGRERVEAIQSKMGMTDPSANEPFLSTRELTLLKWGIPEGRRVAYLNADPDSRHRLLGELPDSGTSTLAITDGPVEVDTIEWFASPLDLCRAHDALQATAARPGLGEVRSILARNPGVPVDRKTFPYVAFKGGSEPGVLALSWFAERSDGRRFAVAALLRNTTGPVPASVTFDIAAAFKLLAQV